MYTHKYAEHHIFPGVLLEDDLALHKPAWTPYISPHDPPAHAVDDDTSSYVSTGTRYRPFVAVDLGNDVTIGRVSIMFGWGK